MRVPNFKNIINSLAILGFGFVSSVLLMSILTISLLSAVSSNGIKIPRPITLKTLKAQSAMEYLMTYGWAILLIAVVMAALFSLGIFGGPALPSTCLPSSGFECTSAVYSHGGIGSLGVWPNFAGNVLLTVGQTTGTSWVSANIFYVPQGTTLTGPGIPSTIPGSTGVNWAPAPLGIGSVGNTIVGGLISGQIQQLPLAVIPSGSASSSGVPFPIPVGATAGGAIWAQYQTSAGGTFFYVQVAKISLKAV